MKRFYDDITDFIFIEDEPVLSDVILIPGSSCSETSAAAAALYLQGYAPWVLPSGRYSLVAGSFPIEGYETEWEYMKDLLMHGGVPEERILREDRATFTWENAIYSRDTLAKAGIEVKQALICCQAFHARRAYTYYQQQFPDVRLRMIPTVTQGISRDNWYLDRDKARVVLGELQRCGDQFRCMIPEADPIGWP